MKTVGIICEYNPFHLGHAGHIEKTREVLGDDTAVVCVMSGNYVQRGDFAIFNKHARAKMAVYSGADLVIELQTPYVLLSAEGFAKAGVFLLCMLGVCDYLSFGSEAGSIDLLSEAAEVIMTDKASVLTKKWLGEGCSYASAQQKAADVLMGEKSSVFKSPNNVLGIEYIKAIGRLGAAMQPVTIERTGGEHDGDTGFSASALRKIIMQGNIPLSYMPGAAAAVCMEELALGRGPVSPDNMELAVLSRLRAIKDCSKIPGASEGLELRFMKNVASEASVASILMKTKTKRYTMARLRRMMMCAALGIQSSDIRRLPPYLRVLAMNTTGKRLLALAREKAKLPIITKPASVQKLCSPAVRLFDIEASATDFYVLGYQNEQQRFGGQEWRQSPIIIE